MDAAGIIAGTNIMEAWEFMRMFLSVKLVLTILGCFLVIIGTFCYNKKNKLRLGDKGVVLGLGGGDDRNRTYDDNPWAMGTYYCRKDCFLC